ncbi:MULTISPECIES: efflux RND transporter permease subunit [Kordiimonas]|jgi:multidrug efflux pump subunit AcrB|uniref:efflux RND transporter permease subunit n=1 Tax=Kordiimonas TaxID=288021 RepID=UPI00257F41B0|nr:efflux RND transporter permease subunit [Kordiimonas sp. UBA4487]
MSFITRFALENSRLVLLFILGTVVAGILTYTHYPRKEDPTVVVREAIVTASYPGMSPARVEQLITQPIEEKIREIPEVDEIRSDSKAGVSIIHVKLADEYFELAPIWQQLRNKMQEMRSKLPDGTNGPVVNDEVGLTAVATIALWSEGFDLAEMRNEADWVREQLYLLDGVKKVELYGAQDERVYLEVSNAKLAQYGISPAVVVSALKSQNIILPGGRVDAGGRIILIEPSGNFENLDQIGDVLIATNTDAGVVSIRDLVTIRRTFVDPVEKPAYFGGKPALVLSVSIKEGVNSVSFGADLTSKMHELQQKLPVGMVLEYATYQPELVEAAVNGAVSNVYQTLGIVLFVVMIFLGVRTGLIVGSIVPMAMLFALIIMRMLDVELQRISIAAMIIALGLLVDNGIVVAEDIRSRMEKGIGRKQACLDAGRTLAIPLLTSSLTTIFAFLPMLMAIGPAGEYTGSLSQVIIVVLLGSWFLAMFVTPSLSFYFAKVKESGVQAEASYDGKAYALYRNALQWVLSHRAVVGLVIVAAFTASGVLFGGVVKEFFPASDRNQVLVYLDMPAGTSVRETEVATKELSAWLSDKDENPEVASNIAYVGDGGPRFYLSLPPMDPDPHLAFVVVNTETPAQVPALIERLRQEIPARHPELRARIKEMWLGSTEAGLVQLRIVGPDADELMRAARGLEAAFASINGVINVRQDWENEILKVRVNVDQAKARNAGVTSEEIANSLSAYLDGAAATEFRDGDDSIPVVLRGMASERDQLAGLRAVTVYSAQTGASVPLSQIADFVPEFQVSRIKRLNQERVVTVEGKHRTLKAGQLLELLAPAIESLDLKAGHRLELGGEIEGSAEAKAALFENMPIALAMIIVLMVWQFNSFRRPLIIMLTIPLSFIGAVAGLVVMNAVFGFMAILGLFSLAGIIINNGIVLIDRIDAERNESAAVGDAVVKAALARARPIIMTTLTTVLGLIPLILFGGSLWFGMANVIAFGLLVGTVLTLFIVPLLYSVMFRDAAAEEARA